MKDETYAVLALKEILIRALDAVAQEEPQEGWEEQFAAMTREQQADWLLQLFSVLMSEILAQKLTEGA